MSNPLWTAVERYLDERLLEPDDALAAALESSHQAGLPAYQVTPSQGKLLWMLARLLPARSILEIGTLGGYSTIWMARALPADGQLISLEADPHRAAVAQENVARAGLADRVAIRVGAALDTLPRLAEEGAGPFDLVFIDADKINNPHYFNWALRLARVGTLIVADNIVRQGHLIDPANPDSGAPGVREFVDLVGRERRVSATSIQTVGSKGHDGMLLALVLEV